MNIFDKCFFSEDFYGLSFLKVLRICFKNCLDKVFEEFELLLFDNVFLVLIF